MIKIEPFTVAHYRNMIIQPAQEYIGEFVTEDHVKALSEHDAFAGVTETGEVIGAAGIHAGWEGRATVWALLGPNIGKNFVQVHRAVKRFLDMQDYRRIEATVDCDFPEGHKWVLKLGFELECERMQKFDPAGKDHALYARVS